MKRDEIVIGEYYKCLLSLKNKDKFVVAKLLNKPDKEKKGRGSIGVEMEIIDENGNTNNKKFSLAQIVCRWDIKKKKPIYSQDDPQIIKLKKIEDLLPLFTFAAEKDVAKLEELLVDFIGSFEA